MIGEGRILAIAGQIAWNANEEFVSDDFGDQFVQALDNVLAILQAGGGRPEDLLSLTIYVIDKAAYIAATKRIGAAFKERMAGHYPTMALVVVSALLEDRAQVEIQALAAVPDRHQTANLS